MCVGRHGILGHIVRFRNASIGSLLSLHGRIVDCGNFRVTLCPGHGSPCTTRGVEVCYTARLELFVAGGLDHSAPPPATSADLSSRPETGCRHCLPASLGVCRRFLALADRKEARPKHTSAALVAAVGSGKCPTRKDLAIPPVRTGDKASRNPNSVVPLAG